MENKEQTLSNKMNECERYGDNCEVNIDKIKEDVRESVKRIKKRFIMKLDGKIYKGKFTITTERIHEIIDEEVGRS